MLSYTRIRALMAVVVALAALVALPPAAVAAPPVQARSWIIMDDSNGEILAAQSPHQRIATASLAKVLTALVAVERGNLEQRVTIVESDLVGEATAFLALGDVVTLRTLLYGLLLRSGNDAAMAIARAVGGSPAADDPAARQRFVDWMNLRSASLGLVNSRFLNPHGLDEPGHYSTAYDLAVITRAALRNPTFAAAFGARSFSAEGFDYLASNRLPDSYPAVVGGKTGWTDDAGLCLIEVAERGGRRLVVVLLDSSLERWYLDAIDLLDYGWTIPVPATSPARSTAVFSRWSTRTDKPVANGLVQRSWIWGPAIGEPLNEPYVGTGGSERIVQYFEKGRMEVNDPLAPPASEWYVTGGRLAWEMITGLHQVGDVFFEPRTAATLPVAGDPTGPAPAYTALRGLLLAPPTPTGALATRRLTADGRVSDDIQTAAYGVRVGAPVRETNHSVASVFQTFLSQRGPVYSDGRFVEAPLFAPAFAVTGLPITEPYWVRVPVGGVVSDVLVQCFERRCLTYTPSNSPDWQVEMGNIGQHYRLWLRQSQPLVHLSTSWNW